jgi:drug/metabolite transporter (DMT)-like permease
MGKFFVLISSIFFALSNAYWKKVIYKVPFFQVIFFRGILSSLLFGILLFVSIQFNLFPYLLKHDNEINSKTIGLTILLCIFSGCGLYFFVKSMQFGKVSIIVPLSSINIFSIATALLILHEPWKWIYLIEFSLVIVGSLFIYQSNRENTSSNQNSSWIITSLLSSIFWGISYALFKIPIKQIGILPFSFIIESSITILSLFLIISSKIPFSIQLLNRKQVGHYLALATFVFLGTFFINMGLKETSILSFTVLSNFGQIITIFLAYLLYNEQLKPAEWMGVCLLLTSIVISILY